MSTQRFVVAMGVMLGLLMVMGFMLAKNYADYKDCIIKTPLQYQEEIC